MSTEGEEGITGTAVGIRGSFRIRGWLSRGGFDVGRESDGVTMSAGTPEWALFIKGGEGGGGGAGESENASVGGPWKAAVPFKRGASMVGDAEDRLETCKTARFGSEASIPVSVILDGLKDASADTSCCASAYRLCAVAGGLRPGGGGI